MGLKRKDKLLIDCLFGNQDSVNQFQDLKTSDWDFLVRQSKKHFVASLLYKRLQGLKGKFNIPEDVIQKLYPSYIHCAARNIKINYELENAFQRLVKSKIPFILLKGTHLNANVYQDSGLRSMDDVDLLFRKEDLKRAQACLMEAGYLKTTSRVMIDVHWYLEQYLDLDMSGIWDMARPFNLAGVDTLILSPEHLIIHLCIHLSFHHQFRFAGLRTFFDIREAIKKYQSDINWKDVIFYSEKWGVRNGVYLTLYLAKTLAEAMVPEDVLEKLKPSSFREEYSQWAIDQIFHKKENEPSLSPYFWQIWKTDSLITKFILFIKLIVPTKEFLSQKYPASIKTKMNLSFYLIRMRDHLNRYASFFWRIVIREEATLCLLKEKKNMFTIMDWLSEADSKLP